MQRPEHFPEEASGLMDADIDNANGRLKLPGLALTGSQGSKILAATENRDSE